MAFIDQFNQASNPVLNQRVQVAMMRIALNVVGETPVTEVATAKRTTLALEILAGKLVYLFTLAICSANSDITIDSLDGDIEFMVSSVFGDFAGVTAADLVVPVVD